MRRRQLDAGVAFDDRHRPSVGAPAGAAYDVVSRRLPAGPGRRTRRRHIIYVPHGVDPDETLPFAVMMHDGGGTSITMEFTVPLAEEHHVVLLLPNSRALIWDAVVGSFGPDATFLDGALAQVFSSCAIDPARVTLGGLSDGATYALALGLLNGDQSTRLVASSPGFLKPVDRHNTPRVFISHGTRDAVLNINVGGPGDRAAVDGRGIRRDVPGVRWRPRGPDAIAREAFAWLS